MKLRSVAIFAAVPALGAAQSGIFVYHAAGNNFYKLRKVQVTSTVIGPIVRTLTTLDYENSFRDRAQVSFNFALPESAALGGFRYGAGCTYRSGNLVSALRTAGSESGTGWMRQVSSMFYTSELPAPRDKSRFRVELWTDGMLQPDGDRLALPKPTLDVTPQKNWRARATSGEIVRVRGRNFTIRATSCEAIAQKFRDGLYYVAGYLHASRVPQPSVRIESASYEVPGGKGRDVTEKVKRLAESGQYFIWASDTQFGDPAVNQRKQLRVVARFGDREKTLVTPENETMNLLGQGGNESEPTVQGLHDLKMVFEDSGTVAFFGWMPRIETITGAFAGRSFHFRPLNGGAGSDAARLWAQQMLATGSVREPDRMLAFSLVYGVPSSATTLVAGAPRRVREISGGRG